MSIFIYRNIQIQKGKDSCNFSVLKGRRNQGKTAKGTRKVIFDIKYDRSKLILNKSSNTLAKSVKSKMIVKNDVRNDMSKMIRIDIRGFGIDKELIVKNQFSGIVDQGF